MDKGKKVMGSSSEPRKDNTSCSGDKASMLRYRRQHLHKQLSLDKREALLAQRRTRYLESKSQKLPYSFSTYYDNEYGSLIAVDDIPKQKTLTIREPSCLSHKGNTMHINDSTLVADKGKGILAVEKGNTVRTNNSTLVTDKGKGILAVEIGSTLATSNVWLNAEPSNKASTSGTRVQHTIEAAYSRKKGRRSTTLGSWNFKQLPTSESTLKQDANTDVEIDEIKEYQSARWVSPPEAVWRLFAFPISEMNPSVYHLQLHLKGAFFIDGPGGSGKTFLYRALLATVRSRGLIALATATSGVAASILPGGRTAHSRFKIPINIDEKFTCNIELQQQSFFRRLFSCEFTSVVLFNVR